MRWWATEAGVLVVGNLRQVVFDVWHFDVLPVLVVAAQFKDESLHVRRNLPLRDLFHDVAHPTASSRGSNEMQPHSITRTHQEMR